MRAGNHEPQADAGGRRLQRRVESGWPVGRQRRRGWRRQGVFEVQWGSRQARVVSE